MSWSGSMSASSHSTWQSLSLPKMDEIPYSPHHIHRAAESLGSVGLSSGPRKAAVAIPPRSHLSPGSATIPRATRLNLPGEPSSAQDEPASSPELPAGEAHQLQLAWQWFVESIPQGRLGPLRRNHPLDPLSAPTFTGYGTLSLDWYVSRPGLDTLELTNGTGMRS